MPCPDAPNQTARPLRRQPKDPQDPPAEGGVALGPNHQRHPRNPGGPLAASRPPNPNPTPEAIPAATC